MKDLTRDDYELTVQELESQRITAMLMVEQLDSAIVDLNRKIKARFPQCKKKTGTGTNGNRES